MSHINSIIPSAALLVILGTVCASSAFAVPAPIATASSVPCAILEKFEGDVQLMDAERNQLLETKPGSPISCGGWVTITRGWALIRHKGGFGIHAGEHTFVQITDPQFGENTTGDHLLLYKGQLAARAGDGSGELKILTANGRARLTRGTSVVVFSPQDVETQLIALDQSATLENRFIPDRRITVKAGESSLLNFSSARVVPGAPRALAIASLKLKLAELKLGEKSSKRALFSAKARSERVFAADLSHQNTSSDGRGTFALRRPASEYARNPEDGKSSGLNQRWVGKLTGGAAHGKGILYPSAGVKTHGGRVPQGVKIEVEETGSLTRNMKAAHKREKVRLIEQLSEIQPD